MLVSAVTARTRILIGSGVLVALALSFAAGRYSRPAHVETRTETVYRDRVVERQTKSTEVKATADVQVQTRTVTRWLPSPAGPIIERTEETGTHATSSTAAVSTETRDVEAERVTTKTQSTTTTQTDPDHWRIGVTAGLARSLDRIYGVDVSRRIIGPVWLGAWATSERAGGLVVAVTW
jgi:hypothetical protein